MHVDGFPYAPPGLVRSPESVTAVIPPAANAVAVLAAAVLFAACGGDRGESSSRRADGPAKAEGRSTAWKPGEAWTLADSPMLRIGSETAPEYQFSGITGAARLSDGRIVVGDAGSAELRIFSPEGQFLRRVGGKGAGPSEFRFLARMVSLAGDSLLVFDAGLARLSVFGPDGQLARTVPVPAAGPGSQLAGVLDDGRFVFGLPLAVPPRDGLSRDSVLHVVFSPQGQPVDTLEVTPGSLYFQRVSGNRVTRLTPPFGPAAVAVARGGVAYVGSTDEYALRQYQPRDGATRTIRRAVEPQAFTDADFQQVLDFFPAHQQAMIREIPRPAQHPVIRAILVDRTGHLWVQDFARPGSADNRWSVFSPDGVLLGPVSFPANFRVLDIGPDYVLGVSVDEASDTESVHLYDLRKNGAA